MTRKAAKKKPCPSCGGAFLRGSYVWRLLPDGPTRQRVCRSCASHATPILASDAPCRCEQCGTALARFCGGCVGKAFEEATGTKLLAALARKGKRGQP